MGAGDTELIETLHWISSKHSNAEKREKTRALLAAGADVNASGEYGLTALHHAVASNLCAASPEVVEILLDSGADVNATTSHGVAPINMAVARDDKPAEFVEASRRILTMLFARGAKPNRTLAHTVSVAPHIYEQFLKAGADPSEIDENGATALHHATTMQRAAILTLLLDRGLDPNSATKLGKTALGLALKAGEHTPQQVASKKLIVDLLRSRGAKERARLVKREGTTPLDRQKLDAALAAAPNGDLSARAKNFLERELDSYEELTSEIPSLHPEDYVPVLRVCEAALQGELEARTIEGDFEVRQEAAFFHPGDLVVSGNLAIFKPFAVLGTLVVKGTLTDCGPDSHVAITHDLTLENLFTTGELHVGGDIVASGVVLGYYNDNTLSASTIHARVVIEDDHSTMAAVSSPHHFDMDRYAQGYGEGVSAELEQIFVPEVFDVDEAEGTRTLHQGKLFEMLRRRQNVFLTEK